MSSIYDLIRAVVQSQEPTITGKVASEFYMVEDLAGGYCWGCDVDIGQAMTYTDQYGRDQTTTVLRNVPIAFNNREIFYAQVGWPVLLRRMSDTRYAIVGLAKSLKMTTDIVYVRFTGGVAVAGRGKAGYYYRRLTLAEMGTVEPFGTIPLGTMGIFNAADDTLVRLKL